jgi:rhodanese-related sulfurtransferase
VKSYRRVIASGVLTLCVLLVVIIFVDRRPVSDRADISPEALQTRIQQGDTTIVLLDVRTPQEFLSETGHLPGAMLIPVQELQGRLMELSPYRGKTIVAYCRSGHRSSQASDMLHAEGFAVLNLSGGIRLWSEKMLPVTRKEVP